MMDLTLINELTKKIKETPQYLDLKEAERMMEADASLFPYISKYQTLQSVFSDALRQNVEASGLKQEFFQAKRQLESKEAVRNYLSRLREFNSYLDEIANIIFKDIIPPALINDPFRKWVEK